MAARLDLFHLRRHALPTHYDIFVPRRPVNPCDGVSVTFPTPRPRLVASWHVDADHRLACTWSAVPDDPA